MEELLFEQVEKLEVLVMEEEVKFVVEIGVMEMEFIKEVEVGLVVFEFFVKRKVLVV